MLEEQKLQVREQQRQAEEQREIASKERARADQLMAKLDELLQLMKAREQENAQLKDELAKVLKAYTDLTQQQKLDRKNRYGSKSQKGIDPIKTEEKSHEEDKGDFTDGSERAKD